MTYKRMDITKEVLPKFIKENQLGDKVLILTDENISRLYLKEYKEILENNNLDIFDYIIRQGERAKSFEEVQRIIDFLINGNFTRNDIFVALGGGVVGDLGGFVSSIYMRGMNFIEIPTTLLSLVDSSIGSKRGINLKQGKNLVGSFFDSKARVVDIDLLKTLPEKELSSGLGEIIKYALIQDSISILDDKVYEDLAFKYKSNENKVYEAEVLKKGDINSKSPNSDRLYDLIKDDRFNLNDKKTIEKIINISSKLKRAVIKKDPYDRGVRQILNYGHTFGHSLEKLNDFSISHGEAVGVGIDLASRYSYKNRICDKETFSLTQDILEKFDLKFKNNYEVKTILEEFLFDKKMKNGKINLILPVAKFRVKVFPVEFSKLKEGFCEV